MDLMINRLKARLKMLCQKNKITDSLWDEIGYLVTYWNALQEIVIDLRETSKEANRLWVDGESGAGQLVDLLVVKDTSIYTIKLFGILACGLRDKGFTVRAVLSSRCQRCEKAYLQLFGVRRFVYIKDTFIDHKSRSKAREWVSGVLSGELSIAKIKCLTVFSCQIGIHVIATLCRERLAGELDFTAKGVRKHLENLLYVSYCNAFWSEGFARRGLGVLALTNEANYATHGTLVDTYVRSGIDVVQFIQPWRDDSLTFRRISSATRREHPSSVSRQQLDLLMRNRWTKEIEAVVDKIFRDRYSGKWFLQSRNMNSGTSGVDGSDGLFSKKSHRQSVCVFSHVLWDANLFYGDDLFEDYSEWFIETFRIALRNSSIDWIFKLHPANAWKQAYEGKGQHYAEYELIEKALGGEALPRHISILEPETGLNTLQLLGYVDYVVTVRGTTGIEAAYLGIPCITAGTGRYSHLGFTIDSESQEEYRDVLLSLGKVSYKLDTEQRQRSRWYTYAAFDLRLWRLESATTIFQEGIGKMKRLDYNLRISNKGPGDDLRHFGDWILSGETDYMDYSSLYMSSVERS